MPIVKLGPAYKDYIWGGTNLKEKYGKKSDLDIVAESWEVSTHPDGPSIVLTGEYAGKTLTEYIDALGKDCLGTKGKEFEFFPMLIKFIDSKQPLSIQVHPDNEYALRVEKEYGKTEMWYILDCEPGATLYFGVNRSITKEEFRQRIEDNTILEVLKEVPVHKGDVFFIQAGTIHAIGAGTTLCEIQQNSNSTYRVYDFGRVGKDGKPRELHIDKAIDVSNLEPIESDFKPVGEPISDETTSTVMLGTCDYFTSFETTLKGSTSIHVDEESFGALVLVEGSAVVENQDTKLELQKGDTIFITANSGEVKVTGDCQWIYSRV